MKAFDQLVTESKAILIIASRPLDFDCLGSGIILKKYLESLGKKITLMYPEPLTADNRELYGFLPYFNEVTFADTREILKKPSDLLILLDGTSLVQFYNAFKDPANPPDLKLWPQRVRIDHHLQKLEKLETLLIRDHRMSSTAEIILQKIIPKKFIDENIATLGYAALVGDTGNFCWNFTAKTLRIASFLISKGAEKMLIINRFFYFKPRNYFKLLKLIIENAQFNTGLRTVFLAVSYQKLRSWKLEDGEYNQMRLAFLEELGRKIRGFDRVITLLEKEPGHVHISARGNNLNNKINLPKMFMEIGGNGGGHFNAIGFEVEGNFNKVKEQTKAVLKKYLRQTYRQSIDIR